MVQHQQSSFPYLGNIAYLLHPVPLMAAIVLQPHACRMRETLRYGLLDLSLLAMMWIYIYAFTTLPWLVSFFQRRAVHGSKLAVFHR